VGLFIGVMAVPARADWWINEGSGFLVPGYIHSETWGDEPASGNGVELTYDYYPVLQSPGAPGYAVGLLGQWERYQAPGHDRFAIGGQVMAPFYGLELAYAQRAASGDRLTTHGVHVAPFVSLGALSLAIRATIPVSAMERNYGTEFGFTLGVKIPVLLHGEGFDLSFPHGRPLKLAERTVVASLSPDRRGWAAQSDERALFPAVAPLNATERFAVSEHWLRCALEEHASIASFSRLALELLSLGAPPELVAGAHSAALDELRHARRCLGVCRALRAGAPELGVFPDATRGVRPVTVPELAVATFREGCLGEQRAARALAHAALEATSRELAELLRGLASDETRHAEYAWHIVEWCLGEDRENVERGVREVLALERASVPVAPKDELPPGWGRLSPRRERLIWRAVTLHAERRWKRLGAGSTGLADVA
jgi:hypothetical protein